MSCIDVNTFTKGKWRIIVYIFYIFYRLHTLQRTVTQKVRAVFVITFLQKGISSSIKYLKNGGWTCFAVMAFQEVWAKSMCRPMEQLVDVEQEYPGEVEYIYIPACVPLWRCSGCCGDDNLECQPTLERNITLEVWQDQKWKTIDQEYLKGDVKNGLSVHIKYKARFSGSIFLCFVSQVMRLHPTESMHNVELKFVEHRQCECR